MKILLSTFGSLGDIHPYIALAKEAQARGHEPTLATASKYQAKIENLGLNFVAIGPDLPPEDEFSSLAKQVMDSRRGTEFLFKELLVPALRQNYADLLTAGSENDVIITHPAAIAGPLAAAKLQKKWLSSVLAPISVWSIHDPPVPPFWSHLDQWRVFGPLWGVILKNMGRLATSPWIREVEKFRRQEKIPLQGNPIFEGQYSPYGTLALFSAHFAAPQQDWPTKTTATGFCFYDAQGYKNSQTDNWREWMKGGEPPIVFTLGSSAVFNADEFLAASRELVRKASARAVYLTGGVAKFDSPLSENELEVDYAPFSELFPLAKFVVHQGGVGTTAQALRAGVPQLIVPHAHDQPDNAGRIRRLGLGLFTDLEKYKKRNSWDTFSSLLSGLSRYAPRARDFGEKIRAEDGPRIACEFIERLG